MRSSQSENSMIDFFLMKPRQLGEGLDTSLLGCPDQSIFGMVLHHALHLN